MYYYPSVRSRREERARKTHIIYILATSRMEATSYSFAIKLAPQPPVFVQAAKLFYVGVIQHPFKKYHHVLFLCCAEKLQMFFLP
jgi:hypothetical protein